MTRKTILLVDDDQALVAALRAGLSDEGFDVRSVDNGVAALDAIRSAPPDLVVLDLMLPGLDGISVCRAIRRTSGVPVIMLTAKKDEVDKVVGLEIGADDYITKPFSFRELLARVKSALRRPEMDGYDGTIGSSVFRRGDLSIDFQRREVRVAGALVTLPLKEYELLATMAGRPGRVFTRAELIDRVWGADFCGDEKTLDVHVRRLRARIEAEPAQPRYILTVRGVGYRMAED